MSTSNETPTPTTEAISPTIYNGYRGLIEDLASMNATLRAQLAAAQADTRRLDWLDVRKRLEPGNCDRWSANEYRIMLKSGGDYYKGGCDKPLRAAIDAAMQEAAP